MKNRINHNTVLMSLMLVFSALVGLFLLPVLLFVWLTLVTFGALTVLVSKVKNKHKPKVKYAFYNGKVEKVIN